MKQDLITLVIIYALSSIVFLKSFNTFFVQDDYILISNFSNGGIVQNVIKSFSAPTVTHYRPMHNLFFALGGMTFQKNYFFYHFFTFLLFGFSSFLIYKITLLLGLNKRASALGTLAYTVSPLHFVALYWISGGAILIGLLFFLSSFYLILKKHFYLGLLVYFLSLLSSEVFIVGSFIIAFNMFLRKGKSKKIMFLFLTTGLLYSVVKLLFLTPKNTFDAYTIHVGKSSLEALYFYASKLLGFPGVGNDLIPTLITIGLTITLIYKLSKPSLISKEKKLLLFSFSVIVLGAMPFLLLPKHTSAHYMAIALWGISILWSILFTNLKLKSGIIILLFIMLSSYLGAKAIEGNNWVIKRSNLAKQYIAQIEKGNYKNKTTLIISDSAASSSEEAYYALGQGKAIDFWFEKKQFEYCFTFEKKCNTDENSQIVR